MTAPPYSGFCKLTLNDDSVVEIEGSGELAEEMTRPYNSTVVSAVIGTLCTGIRWEVFKRCPLLTSVTIPDSVTSIGQSSLKFCSALTSITIPDSVTSIADYAFSSCTALATVTIGNGVTSIGAQNFLECTALATVTIGNGVTNIKSEAFSNCSALTSITVKATTPPTLEGFGIFNSSTCPIYVPAESVETYKTATRWKTYASRIQAIPA